MYCPLCHEGAAFFFENDQRPFYQCGQCDLIFVPETHLPSREEEKAQYDLHENSPDDVGYRKFLQRLTVPFTKKLPPESTGLDFGCGPGPTLSVMLEETGHTVALFDPIYQPNPKALKSQYDFITATEVFEHLHDPKRDLEQLWNALKPEGWLGVMTKRAHNLESFSRWHYIQDPTHVCFWSDNTFRWLAGIWSAQVELIEPDVTLFRKQAETTY